LLQRFPGSDRQVLLLRDANELPYEEIARLLDIEPAAARKRYGRALIHLTGAISSGRFVTNPKEKNAG
jgi:DNA-directed RNA polymerase specialized sigma24 family protein